MRKKLQVLAVQGFALYCLYQLATGGQSWASNLYLFWIWFEFVAIIICVVASDHLDKVDKRTLPKRLDIILDGIQVFVLASTGMFLLSTIKLLSLIGSEVMWGLIIKQQETKNESE